MHNGTIKSLNTRGEVSLIYRTLLICRPLQNEKSDKNYSIIYFYITHMYGPRDPVTSTAYPYLVGPGQNKCHEKLYTFRYMLSNNLTCHRRHEQQQDASVGVQPQVSCTPHISF